MAMPEKPIILVGIDEGEHSFYALTWTLDHFFTPFAPNFPFKLYLLHNKDTLSHAIGCYGPGSPENVRDVDIELKSKATRVIEKAKDLCQSKSLANLLDCIRPDYWMGQARIVVNDIYTEIVEGDPRYVLCEAVEGHHASMLVVGTHGYKALQRAVLGSVSDYCAHHAHCSVMIVKKPKIEN